MTLSEQSACQGKKTPGDYQQMAAEAKWIADEAQRTGSRDVAYHHRRESARFYHMARVAEVNARRQGCVCPFPGEDGYVRENCPVHDPEGTYHLEDCHS